MSHIRVIQFLALVSALTLFTMTAPTADFGSAMALYQKGDYPAALKEFTVLAGHGDADAQLILGDMYAKGQARFRHRSRPGPGFKCYPGPAHP